jgi:hypothetical protein
LALEHGEEERCERDDREERLAQAGVDVHQPVVGEREGPADREDSVEDRSSQRTSARRRQTQDRHQRRKQRRGEREAQARSPERVELAVAEPDRHRVPSGEYRHRDESGERRAVVGGVHGPTLRGARSGRAPYCPPRRVHP